MQNINETWILQVNGAASESCNRGEEGAIYRSKQIFVLLLFPVYNSYVVDSSVQSAVCLSENLIWIPPFIHLCLVFKTAWSIGQLLKHMVWTSPNSGIGSFADAVRQRNIKRVRVVNCVISFIFTIIFTLYFRWTLFLYIWTAFRWTRTRFLKADRSLGISTRSWQAYTIPRRWTSAQQNRANYRKHPVTQLPVLIPSFSRDSHIRPIAEWKPWGLKVLELLWKKRNGTWATSFLALLVLSAVLNDNGTKAVKRRYASHDAKLTPVAWRQQNVTSNFVVCIEGVSRVSRREYEMLKACVASTT